MLTVCAVPFPLSEIQNGPEFLPVPPTPRPRGKGKPPSWTAEPLAPVSFCGLTARFSTWVSNHRGSTRDRAHSLWAQLPSLWIFLDARGGTYLQGDRPNCADGVWEESEGTPRLQKFPWELRGLCDSEKRQPNTCRRGCSKTKGKAGGFARGMDESRPFPYLFSCGSRQRLLQELAESGVRGRAGDTAQGQDDAERGQRALEAAGQHLCGHRQPSWSAVGQSGRGSSAAATAPGGVSFSRYRALHGLPLLNSLSDVSRGGAPRSHQCFYAPLASQNQSQKWGEATRS